MMRDLLRFTTMNLNSDNYHTPFFSVIVPIYNRIDFVNSGISMLLNQTFKDYEVILIDDGSVDGSAESCDEATKYGKLTVIHKENGRTGAG